MKKMTAVLAIITLTFTLSTMALGQPAKRFRPEIQGGAGNDLILHGDGSFRQRNNANRRPAAGKSKQMEIESFNWGVKNKNKTAKTNNVVYIGGSRNDKIQNAGRNRGRRLNCCQGNLLLP